MQAHFSEWVDCFCEPVVGVEIRLPAGGVAEGLTIHAYIVGRLLQDVLTRRVGTSVHGAFSSKSDALSVPDELWITGLRSGDSGSIGVWI